MLQNAVTSYKTIGADCINIFLNSKHDKKKGTRVNRGRPLLTRIVISRKFVWFLLKNTNKMLALQNLRAYITFYIKKEHAQHHKHF